MKILSWMTCAVIPFTSIMLVKATTTGHGIEQGEHTRAIRFQTDVGSAMNVDLSPDGKWVAFDLLGDIYIVSSAGGQATRVTQGAAWDVRPVWSPDGQQLAFIGDQDGTEQAHVIEPWKGGHRWQVTKGENVVVAARSERAIYTLEWSPDGQILLTSAGNTQRIPLHGVATSGPLEAPKETFRNLYYSNGSATYRFVPVRGKRSEIKVPVIGGFSDIYEIRKLDGAGKDAVTLNTEISVTGWEPPLISRSGRWIVYRDRQPLNPGKLSGTSSKSTPFATHADTVSVYDTRTKKSRVLVSDRASKGWRDDGDNRGYSAHRRFAISADSRTLVISYGGKIHKIDIGTGKDEVIDFVADVALDTPPLVKNEFKVRERTFRTQNIRAAQLTPDNGTLVFNALRYIYKLDVRRGTTKRLVDQLEAQFQPSISPDGKSVAYVAWDAVTGGHVWTVPINGGSPTKVTKAPGYYQHPAWSPDGRMLAFVGSEDYAKERGGFSVNVHSGNVFVARLEAAAVNRLQAVARFGNPLSFSSDGRRIRFSKGGNYDVEIRSAAIDGSDERSENINNLSTSGMASIAVMSPDGKLTAAIKYGNLYVVRCKGNELGSKGDSSCEELRVTHDGAADPVWTHKGAALEWTFSDTHYRADAQELIRQLDQMDASAAAEQRPDFHVQKINVKLEIPVVYGRGVIALKGAKIISMRGDEVIENGTVVVKDGRIALVGPSSEVPIPTDANIVDVSGMTIVPGFIDMHAHQDLPRDLLPQNYWESLVYLAFGVTTLRDPSSGGDHPFAYSELVDAGVMTGPRIVPAVGLIPSEARIDSFQDALSTAARYKRLGGTFLKYHSEWDRYQRQWIIDAARKSGMNVAAHYADGGGRINLTTLIDGATTTEHEITTVEDLFYDVRQLVAQSGVSLNFAAMFTYGEYAAEYWPLLRNDPRTLKFYRDRNPPKPTLENLDPKGTALLPLRPSQLRNAEFLAGLMADGSPVAVGSHGNYDGFGFHLEMWTYGRGGMRPHDILKAATINGALGLGMEKDLGSIEEGKVADLVILASDPLEDIKNSLSTVYVMKSGMLRNATTLDLVWPESVPLPAWQSPSTPATAVVTY